MVLGAIMMSFPLAMFSTMYLCLLHGLNTSQGVAIYATVGFAVLAVFTLVFGVAKEDQT